MLGSESQELFYIILDFHKFKKLARRRHAPAQFMGVIEDAAGRGDALPVAGRRRGVGIEIDRGGSNRHRRDRGHIVGAEALDQAGEISSLAAVFEVAGGGL